MVNPTREVIESVDELTGEHTFRWVFTATLEVSDVWVQDGFDLTLERLKTNLEDAFSNDLSFADQSEVVVSDVVITSSPEHDSVRAAMGYSY